MKKIIPLKDRVLVKRSEPTSTKGGILLPDSTKEKPKQGTVVAVGPGKWDSKGNLRPLNLQKGDEVLFSAYAGAEYRVNDEEYLILSEEDVLAVLGGKSCQK